MVETAPTRTAKLALPGPPKDGRLWSARGWGRMAEEIEQKAVELAEAKAGVSLRAGHPVVLVINGLKGNPQFRKAASRRAEGSASDAGGDGQESDAPDGTKNAFAIEVQLTAAGGTPMANERVRLYDPDTGQPVGEPVVTDEKGVLRAKVSAEKDYHVVVENDLPEEHELPSLDVDQGAHEPSSSEHWMLSVELLDAAQAPIKGEKVHVKGEHGAEFDAVTDDEGCFHELAELGVYNLTVRGKSFAAHTILHEDRQGTEIGYRFTVR